uniref:Ubiquitinspecific protease putative n=1 Tax=Albugo laibachii Nc14 TaxID=890382 RepID=F0W954_9STRA|nr:ubiquitinspecific protease putative [Albugo laibachii Nc14]|eukprot:CCA17667.1 ubiquitinspecific protease putative [Albugo laibachii Nc14]
MSTDQQILNDDLLDENWTRASIALSEGSSVLSLSGEDSVEEELEDLSGTIKRPREAQAEEQTQTKVSDKRQKLHTRCMALHRMSHRQVYNVISQAYNKHHGGKMSELELADAIQEASVLELPNLGKHTLENLPLYLRHIMPDWKLRLRKKNPEKSPLMLIMCSSAERVIRVTKSLASFKCRIAKLFSRHTKIEQQEWQLKKFYSPIAIGTPARVKKLLESGALSLQNTAFVVIDMHLNQKICSILDVKETSLDLMELLQYHFMKKISQDDSKLIFY